MGRDESWLRRKRYLGLDHPESGRDGYEKWPRFCAEVPRELVDDLDREIRLVGSGFSRAEAVRSGLRLWLNAHAPEPEPAIEGTAEEIIDLPALSAKVEG